MKQSSAILTLLCVIGAAFLAGGCNKSSGPAPIAITIMPSTTVTLDEGESYAFTAQVKNDTSNTGVTWILYNDKTTVPVSCTIPSCGTLSNITNYSVTYTAPTGLLGSVKVSLQATSNSQESITTVATVTTVLPPMITTLPPLPSGQNGVTYSQSIAVTGGVAPLVYSISSGSLPAGLSVGPGGVISGTPSGSGTSQFTLRVADSGVPPVVVTQAYTITIAPAPPLSIATMSPLPQGIVGSTYNETIASSGGIPPLTWTLIGALPPGLNFTVNTITGGSTTPVTTGQISGIPLTAGTYTFSVEVQDSAIPKQSATSTFTLTINTPAPLKITTASLPSGTTALGYNAVLQATGGAAPYTWTIAPGLLPPGLTLNPSTGVITGTPIRAGTSEFTVTVADSEQPSATASMNYSIVIAGNTNVLQQYDLFDGPYAFLFTGYGKFNSITTFPEVIAGVMISSGNGAIASGTEDVSSNGFLPGLAFTGNYSIGTDGRGSMMLTVIGPSGQKLMQSYQFALDAEGNGQFVEDDSSGNRGSGVLLKQSTSAFTAASFDGDYAFDFFGFDASLKRMVTVGQFHADGSSALTGGSADQNDNGTMSNFSINGSFSGLAADGRGGANLFFSPNTQQYIFYLVSSSEAIFLLGGETTMNGTTGTTVPIGPVGGIAYLETGNPFSGETLNGNYVVTGTGTTAASGDASIFGSLMSFTPSGGTTGATTPVAFTQNDGGTISSALPPPAQYSVYPTGRLAFTGGTGRMGDAYLVNSSQAVFVGTDAEVTSGMIDLQANETYGLTYIQGEYTLKNPSVADIQATSVSGVPVADGAGNLTGEIDFVTGGGAQTLAAELAATYTVGANGTGTLTNGSGAGLPDSLALYLISPEKIRMVSTDPADTHPTLFFLDY
ncbi:MAG TPA: Ig domain-containing protein [Candidatus Acidoferrales bacterium]